jgi:DNA-binding CsgD family transcriptional regulator
VQADGDGRLVSELVSTARYFYGCAVSHRTVESHLYRLFPKLGVTSREEMLAALNG